MDKDVSLQKDTSADEVEKMTLSCSALDGDKELSSGVFDNPKLLFESRLARNNDASHTSIADAGELTKQLNASTCCGVGIGAKLANQALQSSSALPLNPPLSEVEDDIPEVLSLCER